ncbi:FliH/SctL family protein [Arthrobacter sp. MYb227]|uniref:FliH/SctL family protein n=1 Tax=Arthrobacter sp. MYb227 TaxID=1848601 RepID=UPI001C614B00|nr:FliH/SctL family protein [Arthrobacter sp. MYb227]
MPRGFEPAVFGQLEVSGEAARQGALSQTHGYAAGYATGMRAAEAAARRQREHLAQVQAAAEAQHAAEQARAIRALAAAADALTQRTVPVLEQASSVMAETALLLAEKIIGQELSNESLGAKAAIDRALAGIEAHTVREIRMNHEDLSLLGLSKVPGTDIALVADSSLARGDAMTAFAEGFLDARIKTAFERAAKALRGGL